MENMTIDKGKIALICDLDLNKYLGKWYEIAKYAVKEQRNLDNVTATYSLKDNGKILVHNVGYKNGKKRQIKGSAWLRDKKCTGGLYVRFFWPFKSQYNVIKLADDYRYAVVSGEEKDRLWILSRDPILDIIDYNEIIEFLRVKDFSVDNISLTDQSRVVK